MTGGSGFGGGKKKAQKKKLGTIAMQCRRGQRTYVVVTIADKPSPARTEVVGGLLVELSLEGIEGAPGLVDEVGELSGGGASSVGGQRLPVESVVPDLKKAQKAC